MASELKPCPFCGGPAQKPGNQAKSGKRPIWEISCYQYCVSMRRATRQDAINEWNTRKGEEARIAAYTEAAKLALEVLEDELGERVGAMCVQQEDGTWERSGLSDDELKYITEFVKLKST